MQVPVETFSLSFMLCDYAQAIDGKLYIMGAGWNMKGAQAIPFALAGIVKVPWNEANVNHALKIALSNGQGQPFMTQSPAGQQVPLLVEINFKVGRPATAPSGMPFNVPFAVNFGPLLLPPDQYEWRAAIDDTERDDWRLPFSVLAHWPPVT